MNTWGFSSYPGNVSERPSTRNRNSNTNDMKKKRWQQCLHRSLRSWSWHWFSWSRSSVWNWPRLEAKFIHLKRLDLHQNPTGWLLPEVWKWRHVRNCSWKAMALSWQIPWHTRISRVFKFESTILHQRLSGDPVSIWWWKEVNLNVACSVFQQWVSNGIWKIPEYLTFRIVAKQSHHNMSSHASS